MNPRPPNGYDAQTPLGYPPSQGDTPEGYAPQRNAPGQEQAMGGAPYPEQRGYPPPNSPPYGQPVYPGGPYWAPYGVPQPDQRAGMAIASLVLGIASVAFSLFNVCDVPIGVIGLVLGILGLRSTSRHGMALAGVVLCVIGLVLAIGILIVGLTNGPHSP